MILVTGGTGNIGSELLRLLSDGGHSVRAISRNPSAGEELPGVQWVEGDLGDADGLEPIFDGCDRLFVVTGNAGDMVRLEKNAIRAAENAGLAHIVKASALGASDHSISVIGLWHYNIERILRASQLGWTILRPHVFMQNVLDQASTIRSEHKVYSPSADATIPMIDTRDIAAVAAAILTSPSDHAGQRYTLTGPEPISYGEVTEILADVLELPLTYVPETETMAWNRLHGREGQPPWHVGAQLGLAQYQRQGGGTDIITDAVEAITGNPPRTFRQFAVDYAAEFKGRQQA